MFSTVLLTLALSAAPKTDAKLVGTWNIGNEPFVTFSADGKGRMEDGVIKWTADGSNLVVTDDEGTPDKAKYTVSGDSLQLVMGGVPLTLTRAGAGQQVQKQGKLAAKAAKAAAGSDDDAEAEAMAQAQIWMQQNGVQAQGQGNARAQVQPQGQAPQPRAQAAGQDQLSRLLLSSAWCSFSYNKISGATSTSRVVYRADGTWSSGSNREAVSSGPNGSVYSNSNGGGGGQWAVRNGVLHMSSEEYPQLQPLPGFSVTQNSNGSPIINADGREYSMCR